MCMYSCIYIYISCMQISVQKQRISFPYNKAFIEEKITGKCCYRADQPVPRFLSVELHSSPRGLGYKEIHASSVIQSMVCVQHYVVTVLSSTTSHHFIQLYQEQKPSLSCQRVGFTQLEPIFLIKYQLCVLTLYI